MDMAALAGIPGSGAAAERACFFDNTDGQRLCGVLSAAVEPPPRGLGIVFCAPLSEERHCSQRVVVEYARYLARAGYPALRFDPAGCGDSAGDMAAVTLTTLLRDVRAAVAYLLQETGVHQAVIIGARFGALPAYLAADADDSVAALALVCPVVSGADYWNSLLRSQQMSCVTRGLKPPRLEDLTRLLSDTGQVEIKGELFGRDFAEGLINVDLRSTPTRFRGPLLLVSGADEVPDAGPTAMLRVSARATGADVSTTSEPAGVFWSSKALYEGYRPDRLYRDTCTWIGGIAR
jgi:pimeloyl-ACP methyl ester carboxylesterase